MGERSKFEIENQIFSYLKNYYREMFENFKSLTNDGKKLESPDKHNDINNIGVEIVQITSEEKKKRYSYFNNYCSNKVRNKNKYNDSIIYFEDKKPIGIFGPIITGDTNFMWEKNIIITSLKAKLKKLPKYKQFKTNSLLAKLDEYIDFRYVSEPIFSMDNFFISLIRESEYGFEQVFDEYIFLSLIMKKICVFRHDNKDFIMYEYPIV